VVTRRLEREPPRAVQHAGAMTYAAFARSVWSLCNAAERRELLLLFGVMIIASLFEAFGLTLIMPVLSVIAAGGAELPPVVLSAATALGNPPREVLIAELLGAFVLVYVAKNVFLAVVGWRQIRFAHAMDVELSQRLFSLYLSQPYTFHLQRNTAQLANNVAEEVRLVAVAGLGPGLILATEAAVLIGITLVLIIAEPVGALIAGTTLGASGWIYHRVTDGRARRWARERQDDDDLAARDLAEGLGAAKDLLILGRTGEFLRRYQLHHSQRAHAGARHDLLQLLPRLGLEVMALSGIAAAAAFMVFRGDSAAAVIPTLGLFAAVAFRLMPSVGRVLSASQMIRFAAPAVERLHREFASLGPMSLEHGGASAPFRHSLAVSGLSYTYPTNQAPTLVDVSLTVSRGECTGIVGPSGGGKSTLVDLILGLLPPTTGTVTVDGRNIHNGLRAWQDQVGYVPQTIFFTDDTLRRNVALGIADDRIDDSAVVEALHRAQLDAFVRDLPLGLETVIGEKGVRVSGGERQRIGIARALYHQPAILVLDEATSSLDADTERGIVETVRSMRGEKTIIIVSHRPAAITQCDRVYRVEAGRVREVELPAATPTANIP
jgi:ABC-type multidrug transport system fused ATPase/permease subunit